MKEQQMQAAYFVCLAWGLEPSARNINDAIRKQNTNGHPGKGFRHQDICEWLTRFLKSREPLGNRPGTDREPPAKHKKATSGTRAEQAGNPTRAPHKVLELEVNTETIVSENKKTGAQKVPKQPGLDLGAASAPEIDFDVKRLDFPSTLPEYLPDSLAELKAVAEVFCKAFSYLKAPAKIEKGLRYYVEALSSMKRFRPIETAVAWQAFRDAVIVQGGKPLFPPQAKTAFNYLPGRSQPKPGPRVDSCGCPLPQGVYMPRIAANETAHYDGDGDWIIGNTFDPKPARRA